MGSARSPPSGFDFGLVFGIAVIDGRSGLIGRRVVVVAPVQRLARDHLGDLVAGQRLVLQQTLRQPVQIVALLGQDPLGGLIALVDDLVAPSASIIFCVSGDDVRCRLP